MEASKVTIGAKTYDMNYLKGKKKTALRRKLIVEYIQSVPAGELLSIPQLQKIGHFSTNANTHTFIQRMIRDGVISRYDGDRPRTYYYAVVGAARIVKPKDEHDTPAPATPEQNLANFIKELEIFSKSGLQFTLTISNGGPNEKHNH